MQHGGIQATLHVRVLEHPLIINQNSPATAKAEEAMGQLGRITSLSDLPADKVLLSYIKQVQLNEQGIRLPRPEKPKTNKKPAVPKLLAAALKRNRQARPSHKQEYIEWIAEAKRDETRVKRVETTIAWLAEGKPRNWKYMSR